MKIKIITWQHRRDFEAIFECEHCGYEFKRNGCYDDRNFHHNVIPNLVCLECGKKAPASYRPLETKYQDYEVI